MTKHFPVTLIEKLDELHACYTLDLFTDEPLVENPTPEVLALLRQWEFQNGCLQYA